MSDPFTEIGKVARFIVMSEGKFHVVCGNDSFASVPFKTGILWYSGSERISDAPLVGYFELSEWEGVAPDIDVGDGTV